MQKSIGHYLVQLIILSVTFIFQLVLLIKLYFSVQLKDDVVTYVMSNGAIVGGYLIELVDLLVQLKAGLCKKRIQRFTKIAFWCETVSVILDLTSIFIICVLDVADFLIFLATISIVGIGAHCLLFFILLHFAIDFKGKMNYEDE